MKQYKLIITMQVSDNWVEDGFNPMTEVTQKAIQKTLQDNLLQYSYYGIEYKVRIDKVEKCKRVDKIN